MSYIDTFILVAADCPATSSVVPVPKGDSKPVHVLQYELLANNPYRYTFDELLYEVHIRHKAIPEDELATRGDEIRAELLSKSHPCLRASMLPKKYGWGVHHDEQGRIALYPIESEEYQRWSQATDGSPKLLYAMRNKREK